MYVRAKDCSPLERMLLSWVKGLHVFSNVTLGLAAKAVLFLTSLVLIDSSLAENDWKLLYNYEQLYFFTLFGCAGLLSLFSIIGAFALTKSSRVGILLNGLLILLFFIGKIAFAVFAVKSISKNYMNPGPLHNKMYLEMRNYAVHKKSVVLLQSTLACCGVDSYEDWNMTSQSIPPSCCQNGDVCDVDNPTLHTEGCFESLKIMMRYYGWISIVGMALLSAIEIFAVIISIVLFRSLTLIRRKQIALEEATVKIPRILASEPEKPNEESETVEEVVAEEPKTEEEAPPEAAEPAPAEAEKPEMKCIAVPRVNADNSSLNTSFHPKALVE